MEQSYLGHSLEVVPDHAKTESRLPNYVLVIGELHQGFTLMVLSASVEQRQLQAIQLDIHRYNDLCRT